MELDHFWAAPYNACWVFCMCSYSCVLKMTVSKENTRDASSPRSGLSSTVRMNVTIQTTFRKRRADLLTTVGGSLNQVRWPSASVETRVIESSPAIWSQGDARHSRTHTPLIHTLTFGQFRVSNQPSKLKLSMDVFFFLIHTSLYWNNPLQIKTKKPNYF